VDGPLPAGPQRLAWTPRGIGAGVYFVRVETSRGTEGARVVVLR
jgi:hypothetical protein